MQLVLNARKELAAHEEVSRVVFASVSDVHERMYETLESIRASALRHNRPAGIAAVLLAQSGWFVHWAEGPAASLRGLLARVLADRRHRDAVMLHNSHGHPIIPTAWSMVMSLSTEPPVFFTERVRQLSGMFKAGRQLSPPSVLRRLGNPMRLDDLQHSAHAESFHRIGLCASTTQPAFDLLRWMGRQFGRPVHERRFADDGADAQSDYMDLMIEGQVCRVVAVARACLLHGIFRIYIADCPSLVLLFDGNAQRDDALANRVRVGCIDAPRKPHVLGIAPSTDVHGRMSKMFAGDGMAYSNAGVADVSDSAAVWYFLSEIVRGLGPPAESTWSVPDPSPRLFVQ